MIADHDRSDLGSATSAETAAELGELALARSRATGRPVILAGFSSSGRAHVLDVVRDDFGESLLAQRGAVPIEPSGPLGEPSKGGAARAAVRRPAR
jgi:hypothetical protein